MKKVYLQSGLLSKGNSIKENIGSMCALCVCGAFFVFCLYRSETLLKFPSEPPAFTKLRVGGGEGNFTIPFGEPVFMNIHNISLKGWAIEGRRRATARSKERKSPDRGFS